MRKKKKNDINRFKDLSIKIEWKEFHYFLIKKGKFKMKEKSGSIRVFTKLDTRFTVHEPHGKGDKIVAKIDRKKAVMALIKLGCLEENNC